MDQADDVGDQRRVVLRVDRGLQVADVAADAGEILLEVDQQTVGRVLVVVERVVVQRIAERRGQRLAALQFLADRQRGFAVAVAPQADAGGVGGGCAGVSPLAMTPVRFANAGDGLNASKPVRT